MFAIAIRYLNGWAIAAADGAKKELAEWPPHPDRVFMALAAAWFDTGEDTAEGAALRWLEDQDPPAIAASDADLRQVTTSFVPVNDTRSSKSKPAGSGLDKLKGKGLDLLPEHRSRQPRSFPVAIPHDSTVYLFWKQSLPSEHRTAMNRLLANVTHVGHSASFVQVWIPDHAPDPRWKPTGSLAERRLRVPHAGRLAVLKQQLNRDEFLAFHDISGEISKIKATLKDIKAAERQGSSSGHEADPKEQRKRLKQLEAERKQRFPNGAPPSQRPTAGQWQAYGSIESPEVTEFSANHFNHNLVVLRISGKRISLPGTLRLTGAMRGALLKHCPRQPLPEWLTGHTPDGRPSRKPHLAVLPLPFVGSQHADGSILGIALALPREMDEREAVECLTPFLYDETGLSVSNRLFDGEWLECQVEQETRERPPQALRPQRWTRPSRVWASVTPVALDRHYDGNDRWRRVAEDVKQSCERIGLPRPIEVVLHPVSLVEGAPHAREFTRMIRKSDGASRNHSHAVLVFDQPVNGPVMIGAGRFRGYGLCLPMDQE